MVVVRGQETNRSHAVMHGIYTPRVTKCTIAIYGNVITDCTKSALDSDSVYKIN